MSEGLTETIALVQATADVANAATNADLAFTTDHRLEPVTSADPAQVDELSNNYSVFDHSNKARYPGFDDCDRWSNAFDDGWSAFYAVTADSAHLGDDDRSRVLEAVREHWAALGYTILPPSTAPGDGNVIGIGIETDFGRIGFGFNLRRGTAQVTGATACLPPS